MLFIQKRTPNFLCTDSSDSSTSQFSHMVTPPKIEKRPFKYNHNGGNTSGLCIEYMEQSHQSV